MKKRIIALVLCALLAFSMMTACAKKTSSSQTSTTEAPTKDDATTAAPTTDDTTTAAVEDDTTAEEQGDAVEVNYEQFMAAEEQTLVKVKVTVAACQKYNAEYGNTSIYAFDEDGAYFIYRIGMTQEEYDSLAAGKVMVITGYKTAWAGEVEIGDVQSFEVLDETGVSVDAWAWTSDEAELLKHQNQKFTASDFTIVASTYKDENEEEKEAAFLYNWDGSGERGNDLYFNVSDGTNTYSFVVESDLCDSASEVYKTVETLKIGDKVDVTGFLYWYNGPNPHITAVTVK